jgi:EAL domain-containing protein (putative c-di-GMP-specific phosphodiesterase class I)
MVCLERVRKLGVGLSIDDFGKGYSSLSYLKEIPATEVKIDRRFVSMAALDDKDRQIVRAIVELARAFRMSVVAEGVDSGSALRAVTSLGCDAGQGFFIARPMRAELVGEWLRGLRRESARFSAAAPRRRRKWTGLHA